MMLPPAIEFVHPYIYHGWPECNGYYSYLILGGIRIWASALRRGVLNEFSWVSSGSPCAGIILYHVPRHHPFRFIIHNNCSFRVYTAYRFEEAALNKPRPVT
jgi:hypothetical protein